ncbi:MAG: hypothetical protein R8G66_11165 [Cytophagales bacterium]|nr:hypothetical protein [Cytophagales bacterium]
MKKPQFLSLLALATFFLSCSDQPKVIEATSAEKEQYQLGIFYEGKQPLIDLNTTGSKPTAGTSELHTIVVKETLPTSKYIYLKVDEKGEEYWVATNKMEVAIGDTYFYRAGLLKRNFRSKEHNRTFDKLYLVSSLVPVNHGRKTGNETPDASSENTRKTGPIEAAPGSIKIAELISNPEKYAGKTIQLTAECTKVNARIMGRNWLHLKDGSKDDFDLVVTSATNVPVGHQITLTGTVAVKKDFGSGYYYDILVENGQVVAGL